MITLPYAGGPAYSEEPKPWQGTSFTIGNTVPKLSKLTVKGIGKLHIPKLEELEESDRSDIVALAGKAGLSSEEYVPIAKRHEAFSSVIDYIWDEFPEKYVTSAWPDKQSPPTVTLTGSPNDEIISKLQQLPFDVEVRFGARLSFEELESLSGKAVEAVVKTAGTAVEANSIIGDDAQSIIVTYAAKDASEDNGAERLMLEERALGRNLDVLSMDELPTTISFVSDPYTIERVQPEVDVWGGQILTKLVNGGVHCTTGFSAVRNGVRGIVTANHCRPNTIYYRGLSGVISFVARGETDSNGQYDLKFYRTNSGHTTSARFRADSGDDIRTVVGTSNPAVDDPVCNYGRATKKKDCSWVQVINRCFVYDGERTYCGIAVTFDYITKGGNSGGPWFRNNTAKGIHAGRVKYGIFPERSMFTRIGAVSSRLDSTVLKG
ncbi:hypothetical protein J4H92_01685 [Leucobacter weissii]|uniref:Peptidase S1 domain-containing protein n=1 Tax=Leucobacter weissii TaxID=1983706 RepID=A0A939S982_9MICO|nr:S1 family peptidase [Leucobacter weissii]MBO1900657.1 hypothetical protein [Leucobacter weissii]